MNLKHSFNMSKEDVLQEACVKYFRLQYPSKIIYAIPNGGSRNIIEAVKLKRTGTLSGVADLCVPCSNGKYHALFIELKVGKNKQSESQITFKNKVEMFGNCYELVYSFDEFVKVVKKYFE